MGLITCTKIGTTLVVQILPDTKIPDLDWERFLDEIQGFIGQSLLVYVGGSGLVVVSVSQMRAAAQIVRNKSLKAKVLTDHKTTKALVTAASWLGAEVTCHSHTNLTETLESLNLTRYQEKSILRLLEGNHE